MFSRFIDLFLSSACGLCDRPCGEQLCDDCRGQLWDCRLENALENAVAPTPLPVMSWGYYGGSLKRAIARLKYDGQQDLADPLGVWLAEQWLERRSERKSMQQAKPLVVPVPLHADKQRQRGFNQAALIADSFCRRASLSLVRQGLVRVRATAPQFGLGGRDRHDNLHQAFALGPALQRHQVQTHQQLGRLGRAFRQDATSKQGATKQDAAQPILLLDDIYTSGATVQAAREVLQAAGFSVCGVATVARAGASPVPIR